MCVFWPSASFAQKTQYNLLKALQSELFLTLFQGQLFSKHLPIVTTTFYCYKLDWLDFPFWALTFVHFLEHKDYKSKVSSQIDEMSSFQMLCTMNLALKTFPRLKNQDHKRTRHWKIFSFVSIICHVEVESLICTFYFLFRLNAELKIVVLICCWFPYCTFLVNSWHEIFTLKFSHSICRRLELSQPLMFRSLPL